MPWSDWQDGWVRTSTTGLDGARHFLHEITTDSTGSTRHARLQNAAGKLYQFGANELADGLPTADQSRVADDGATATFGLQQTYVRFVASGPGTGDVPTPLAGLTYGVDYGRAADGALVQYEDTNPRAVTWRIVATVTGRRNSGAGGSASFRLVNENPNLGSNYPSLPPVTSSASPFETPDDWTVWTQALIFGTSDDAHTITADMDGGLYSADNAKAALVLIVGPESTFSAQYVEPATADAYDWSFLFTLAPQQSFSWTTSRWRYWIPAAVRGGPYWGVRAA